MSSTMNVSCFIASVMIIVIGADSQFSFMMSMLHMRLVFRTTAALRFL